MKRRFDKLMNRTLIALYASIKGIRKNNNVKENKNILIIFQQIFGDAVVFSKALNAYTEIYSQKDGYKVTLIARPSVIAFMKATVPLDEQIDIQPVDFKKLVEDFEYFKVVVEKYKDYADTIIVPGTSLSAEILSCTLNANRKIGLVRSVPIEKPFIMAWFYRLAYTETVKPTKEDMMLQRHRLLLNYLGLKEYKATLPVLLKKEQVINDEHYVVCSPGSSKTEKCWPIERFCEVIDFINNKYGMKVYLCGGTDESEFENKILEKAKHPEMLVSCIGKTNFSEWSAIVQHADLVLGNDSATMHLAAAARVSSICIAGIYDKFQFFPYKVDVIAEDDKLPVTLYKNMSCEWCRTIGYDAGFGNEQCGRRISENKCAICIAAITTNETIAEVEKILG